tara:strand:- start:8216 stop:8422 length:207 start_codon:yes stop_codon:yes gene_type:complete
MNMNNMRNSPMGFSNNIQLNRLNVSTVAALSIVGAAILSFDYDKSSIIPVLITPVGLGYALGMVGGGM